MFFSHTAKIMKIAAFFTLISVFSAPAFTAQETEEAVNDRFTLKVAVIGPGDELYFWWGHLALVIEDNATGAETFYDWGVFSFESEDFFVDFAMGRLIYLCAASRAELNFERYRRTNRDIILYTLDLSPEKKAEIRDLAENNIRPENRDYLYHHFNDNCATRVRDILDAVLDGQFKAAYGEETSRYTLREHISRYTWFSPFFNWALNFLMGQDIDRPITVWREMFLPDELGRCVAEFSYIDEDGKTRPLVSSVEVLSRAIDRPAILDAPRNPWIGTLILGIGIALLLVFFDLLRDKKPVLGRRAWALTQSVLGFFFGVMGSVLFFMTFFTDHDYTFHNANVIFVNPLWFTVFAAGLALAFAKSEKKRFTAALILRVFWTYVLLGGLLTMAIKLSPTFFQQNQPTQALIIPFAFVLSFAGEWLRRLARRGKKTA